MPVLWSLILPALRRLFGKISPSLQNTLAFDFTSNISVIRGRPIIGSAVFDREITEPSLSPFV